MCFQINSLISDYTAKIAETFLGKKEGTEGKGERRDLLTSPSGVASSLPTQVHLPAVAVRGLSPSRLPLRRAGLLPVRRRRLPVAAAPLAEEHGLQALALPQLGGTGLAVPWRVGSSWTRD